MTNLSAIVNPNVLNFKPYEPGKPIETLADEYHIALESIAKLASNESPMGPAPLALAAMKKYAHEMNLYPDGACCVLRRALSRHYNLPENYFMAGQGSNEIIELLGHLFLNSKNGVLTTQYSFAVYRLTAQLFQAPFEEVPTLAGFENDVSSLIAAARKRQNRLLFLCNPNNPTGTFLRRAALVRLLNHVPQDTIVVLDEAYAEIATSRMFPNAIALLEHYPNLIILRTFSKAYGLAGLRIGYAIAHPEMIDYLNRVRQPFNTSRMAQLAAAAALSDHAFVKRSRDHFSVEQQRFYRALKRLNLPYVPTCTNFMLIQTGNGRDVTRKLEQQGLIVRPMDAYHLPDYIRVSFGTQAENKRLIEALKGLFS